ncbi:MAG: cysteate synthase [Asgard group archaeon]
MGDYSLECLYCGSVYNDDYQLACDRNHEPAFLRTRYSTKQLKHLNVSGMFKFCEWLPCNKILNLGGLPATYKSETLGRELGLKNLYVSFSGYWPEKNAYMETCSFKELEAPPTIARASEIKNEILVVASAGNTGRAFGQFLSKTGYPGYIVVPESGLEMMWLLEEPAENVKLIAVKGDYSDAISISNKIASFKGFIKEGGAKNVARRDGMGTVMLEFVATTKRIPDSYFQVIGSGTGAIATWEAVLRLIEDSRFGYKKPELHLSQNHPFKPIYTSWKQGSRKLVKIDESTARKQIEENFAKVLTNRNPPYSIIGGVYDALKDTNGEMYSVTNEEAIAAKKLFKEIEEIDILPAASVCFASLIQAMEKGNVEKEDLILLNITGGGFERLKEDYSVKYMQPDIIVDKNTNLGEILELGS